MISAEYNIQHWVHVANGIIWVKKSNAKAGKDPRRAWAPWTPTRQGNPEMPRLCLGSFNTMSLPWVLTLGGWCCSYGTTEGKNRQFKFSLLTNPLIPSYFKGKSLPKAWKSLLLLGLSVERFRDYSGQTRAFLTVSTLQSAPGQRGELCWTCSLMLCSS